MYIAISTCEVSQVELENVMHHVVNPIEHDFLMQFFWS